MVAVAPDRCDTSFGMPVAACYGKTSVLTTISSAFEDEIRSVTDFEIDGDSAADFLVSDAVMGINCLLNSGPRSSLRCDKAVPRKHSLPSHEVISSARSRHKNN